MYRYAMMLCCVVLGISLWPAFGQTQMTVGIQDVLSAPEKFVNTRLQLVGEIRNPQQGGEVGRGTYQLCGPKGEAITVQTRTLPGAGEMSGQYIVTGSIDIDPATSMCIMWEANRQSLTAAATASAQPVAPQPDPWTYVLIGGGVILLILIIALVVVLTGKPKAAPVVIEPGATVAAPAAAPVAALGAAAPTAAYAPPGAAATQEFMGITLNVTEGPDAGKSFVIASPSTTIGRNPGQDIRLTDGTVSREHARLLVSGGGLTLINQSTRGTSVNEAEVDSKSLSDGDTIRLGATVMTVKMAGQAAPADAPTAEYRPAGSAPPGATQEFLGAQLEVVSGPHTGEVFAISRRSTSIGRAEGQDITLAKDDTVSREHGQLRYQDGQFTLVAAPEKQVRVNGTEVVTAALNDNDLIQLGATQLRFVRL